MRICAVVVTYNRKELLMECLDALFAQSRPVDEVYLVDNASTDGTRELLEERGFLSRPELRYIELEDNVGGAGGFARGFEVAREAGCEWVWVMDDDAEPARDALERLLESPPARDERTVAVCPKVAYPNGAINDVMRAEFRRRLRPLPDSAYRPGHHPAIGMTSFVGPLFRMTVVRAIDPPKAEFFVWGDDVEYSLRLRRLGAIRLVPESLVLHKPASQSYMNRRARFWNTVLPIHFFPTPLESFWQNLDGLRNYIWTKRHYEGQSALSAAGTTLQFVVKHVLYDEQPFRRVPWILRYARDGRRGRFHNIKPAEWRAMVRQGKV